jgi:dihydroxyacetone kinase-like protein
MALTTDTLRFAIERINVALETEAPRLTELDGKLGDGDLGITLDKAFRAMAEIESDLPDELGPAFGKCAVAVNKASSSSFGTLMATALMASGKFAGQETAVPWDKLSAMLTAVLEALIKRGGAKLGDKTVLDTVEAALSATAGLSDPDEMLSAARAKVGEALAAFRDKPNQIGRARVYAERSIGLDDPGMAAFAVMLDAIAEPSST